ncbi:hypothetical protein J6590_098671 [Homalodisca vitripennis]|nr:hypothetical protein J6590_098671 [Homalodisca vitripennis]
MPRKQNCIACLYAERVLAHSERLQTSDATPDFGPISKHPFKCCRVSTTIPCQPLVNETRESDSGSQAGTVDLLSTP